MRGWLWRRRENRHAQHDADRLDRALDGGPLKSFRREVELARTLASEITTTAEPPEAARVALRAGLGVQHLRRRRAVARAGFALATMAATVAAILGLTLSGGAANRVAVSPEANQAISRLDASIKSLQDAVKTGNLVEIQKSVATAQAAVADARKEAAALPAPSRDVILPAIQQSDDEINFLKEPASIQYASTTPRSTSTTSAAPTTTTQARHPSTTTSTSTPSSTTTTSTTTPHGTTTSTRPPSTTTPSTTTPPTTTSAPGATP